MLMIALEQYYQAQVPEVLQSLFEAINNADIAGAPRPTPWERGLMRRCSQERGPVAAHYNRQGVERGMAARNSADAAIVLVWYSGMT